MTSKSRQYMIEEYVIENYDMKCAKLAHFEEVAYECF